MVSGVHATPVTNPLTSRALQVAAVAGGTLALQDDGVVRGIGTGTGPKVGALGNGTTGSLTKTTVLTRSKAEQLACSAEGFGCCALLIDGGVQCWGPTGSGQLGDGVDHKVAFQALPRDVDRTVP